MSMAVCSCSSRGLPESARAHSCGAQRPWQLAYGEETAIGEIDNVHRLITHRPPFAARTAPARRVAARRGRGRGLVVPDMRRAVGCRAPAEGTSDPKRTQAAVVHRGTSAAAGRAVAAVQDPQTSGVPRVPQFRDHPPFAFTSAAVISTVDTVARCDRRLSGATGVAAWIAARSR